MRGNAQDGKALTDDKRRWQELGTLKSGIFFTTSTLKDLSTEYTELTQQYSRTQSGLVKEVVNIACECMRAFRTYASG